MLLLFPRLFPKGRVGERVWHRAGSHATGPWLLTPAPCPHPASVAGAPPFSARRSSRSPFAQGNTYSADLKEQFRASTEQLNCS